MKKENTKSPIEIDWRVDASKIVFFEVQGGKEVFTMGAERFGLILNADYVKELLWETVQEKVYPIEWTTLSKFAEFANFMERGLNFSDIGKLEDRPEHQVRVAYNAGLARFGKGQGLIQERKRQAAGDGTYVELETPWPADYKLGQREPTTHIMLNLREVAEMLKGNGNNYREVWQKFGVKSDAFSRWLDANQKALEILGVVL